MAELIHHIHHLSCFVRPDVPRSRVSRHGAELLVLATSESFGRSFASIEIVDVESVCAEIRHEQALSSVRSFKDKGCMGMRSRSLSPVSRWGTLVFELLAAPSELTVLTNWVHQRGVADISCAKQPLSVA